MADRTRHLTVTFTGSAQQVLMPRFGPIRDMTVQAGAANSNPFYCGGEGVSATDYGTRIPAPVESEPAPPWPLGNFQDGSVFVHDLWIIGTENEKAHFFILCSI